MFIYFYSRNYRCYMLQLNVLSGVVVLLFVVHGTRGREPRQVPSHHARHHKSSDPKPNPHPEPPKFGADPPPWTPCGVGPVAEQRVDGRQVEDPGERLHRDGCVDNNANSRLATAEFSKSESTCDCRGLYSDGVALGGFSAPPDAPESDDSVCRGETIKTSTVEEQTGAIHARAT